VKNRLENMKDPDVDEISSQLLRLNNALTATIKDFCSTEPTPIQNITRVLKCLTKFYETKQK